MYDVVLTILNKNNREKYNTTASKLIELSGETQIKLDSKKDCELFVSNFKKYSKYTNSISLINYKIIKNEI